MKKRILSLLLAALLVFSILPVASFADAAQPSGNDLVQTLRGLIGGGSGSIDPSSIDPSTIAAIAKMLVGDKLDGTILDNIDPETAAAVISGLISGKGDITDMLKNLDPEMLNGLVEKLDNDTIKKLLENVDPTEAAKIITGLINGDTDISSLIENLDPETLKAILDKLDNEQLKKLLENLDMDTIMDMIKNGSFDLGKLTENMDAYQVLQLLSGLMGTGVETTGPEDVTVTEPESATFTVNVTKGKTDELKYMWVQPEKVKAMTIDTSGDMMSIATSVITQIAKVSEGSGDTLTIDKTSTANSGNTYVCIVYKLGLTDGIVHLSDEATLTVNAAGETPVDPDPADPTDPEDPTDPKDPEQGDCTHASLKLHPAVAVTCTTGGSREYYECEKCGKLFVDKDAKISIDAKNITIPATGHTKVVDVAAAEATCTEDGRTEGSHCSVCGTVLSVSEVIKATGHDFGSGRICSKCGQYARMPFVDVHSTDWFYTDVYYAWAHSMFDGMTPTTFEPMGTATRAQTVMVLYRLAGSPDVAGSQPFKDTDRGAWYEKAIIWGYNRGIINGYSPTTFGPNDPVTRAQFVTMLYRYLGLPTTAGSLDGFVDGSTVASYYRTAVAWASQNGIVLGYPDGTFRPDNSINRAELATILARYHRITNADPAKIANAIDKAV